MTYIYSIFLQNVKKLANLTENNTHNSNDNKIRRFFEQARTIMVCGTCKGNPAKVYQCCNGHPVCRKCLSYDMLCSICKKSIYFGKCTTLDNVADSLLQEEIFDAYERIAEILECSICYERITPPLKLCSLGHLVCESCRKRIVICPVCNNNFTVKKNKLLEKLIYHFPFHCCYHDKGCCAIENYTEIMRHEKKCQFKEYKCQVPKCKWKGRETEILSHVEENHTNVVIRSSDRVKLKFGSVSSTQPEVVWKITNLVPAYGRYFWQHFRFVNGRILFVTLITGSKEDADQFKVIIQGRFWSLPYDVFSEDADVNAFFYASNPEAYDISYMMKDKVIGTCPFGMSMESDYKIIIQRTNLGIFGLPKMWELLGITVFSSVVAILLFKSQMRR